MKILFISTEVWSEKNPEGIVCRKLVSGFLNNNTVLDILTIKSTGIHNLHKEYIVHNDSNELLSKVMKKITGIEKKDFVNDVIKNYHEYKFDSYDLVITRSEPFYIHEIGYFIKNMYPSVKWVASFGDPVFLNPYNSKSFLKKHTAKKLEQKYWDCADLITHTNQVVINEYSKYGFDITKAFVLENPFVSQKTTTINNEKKEMVGPITFAYIGSLYGKRNIRPVIKFLSTLDFDFKLLIIGGVRNTYYENRFGGITKFLMKRDQQKILKPIIDYKLQNKVQLLPFMNKIDLDSFIEDKIDVLINIDACIGDTNFFLSSKIVEYLQYLKPILNFSIKGATVDFLAGVGVNYYIDLKKDKIDKFKLSNISKLLPCKNIDNYTADNIVERLLKSL